MKFFLSLKHWQLFLLVWSFPLIVNVMSISDPFVIVRYFPATMTIFIVGVFGWVWSIATVLYKKLPADVKINIRTVHILFLIPMVYMAYLLIFVFSALGSSGEQGSEQGGLSITLLLIAHLGSTVCIFMGLRYAAKIMKSVELGRMAKFGDYAGEFFLIWFQPIGVWMVQPRLNKMVREN